MQNIWSAKPETEFILLLSLKKTHFKFAKTGPWICQKNLPSMRFVVGTPGLDHFMNNEFSLSTNKFDQTFVAPQACLFYLENLHFN